MFFRYLSQLKADMKKFVQQTEQYKTINQQILNATMLFAVYPNI